MEKEAVFLCSYKTVRIDYCPVKKMQDSTDILLVSTGKER